MEYRQDLHNRRAKAVDDAGIAKDELSNGPLANLGDNSSRLREFCKAIDGFQNVHHEKAGKVGGILCDDMST